MILSKMPKGTLFLFFISFLIQVGSRSFAQEFSALEISETVVDFNTKSKLEGVSVVILEKRDDGSWEEYARSVTSKKAFVSSQLYLQKEYMVVFSKKGYIKKKILIDTRMDGIDEDFYEHDNVLFLTNKIEAGEEDPSLLDKPVVKVFFSKAQKGFVFDSLYTASIKTEIEAIPQDLLDRLKKTAEKNAEVDVVDPVKVAEADKEYQKLLAQIEAERIAREQAAIARAKFVEDSIAAVANRAKFVADSTIQAQLQAQRTADSLADIAEANRIRDSIKASRPLAIVKPKNPIVIPTPKLPPSPAEEKPLSIGRVMVLDMKMQDEIFIEKSETVSETNVSKAVKVAIEKEKMDNMHVKYQTGSPFISLLDEIDIYAKSQKTKN